MNARDAALIELDRAHLPGWRGGGTRGRSVPSNLDPRDRALAEQISVGVIKNLLLLRHLIAHHSGRSLRSIDEVVQKILAIGLYQLRFLDRIPPSAAVDEAVEQTRRFGRSKASGFVNAVLRNALRSPDPPMSDDVRWSHPPELLNRIRAVVGDENVEAFCRHDNSEPPTIVRLLPGASIEQLADPSVVITPHEQSGMVVVAGAKRSLLADWARRGLAQPQDPTSADVIEYLDLQPGQRVLDRCAGLGTKTIQVAERIGAGGEVVAIDPAGHRVNTLRRVVAERKLSNASAHPVGWMRDVPADVTRQPFHRVLIDAPCSNSGVLARRSEARYAQDETSLASLRKLQLDILNDTASHVAPGGRLVYSTCSIWREENDEIVDSFLSHHPEFERVESRTTLPSLTADPQRYHDGGFWVVLLRRVQTTPD
jgi:16S rRNA (cytosine967-C5)-methyltransferase